jgi:DNA-binding LytR/AlgR family response regulator
LEAADNYIKICYINKEKVSHFILRNSLKNIENLLTNSNLVRCHRSYMINLSKENVLRREKDGLYIELDSNNYPTFRFKNLFQSGGSTFFRGFGLI